MVDNEFEEDGVLSYGHINRDVFTHPLHGQLQRDLATLVLPRVRKNGQRPLLPLQWDGLQDIEGPPDKVVLLLIVPVNQCKKELVENVQDI